MEHQIGPADLADESMRQVEAAGTKILLVRTGGGYHAFAARCPHYEAPLAKGLLHDGRLLCPWHQSMFDATTGDLLEPPALDALPEFPVRVADGTLYVDLPEKPAGRRRPEMAAFDPAADARVFALVGGGAASAAAVGALREAGYQGRIVMVTPEDDWPYDRPNLTKDYLAGTAQPEWLPLRSAAYYEKLGVERLQDRVTTLDVTTRTLEFASSEPVTPDAVLVAPGATPRTLPAPGAELPGVFTLRSLADCDALIAAAEGASHVVVVGGSFIGMEAAASLRQRGLDVTVVTPDETPFQRTLGEAVGRVVQALHEAHGVALRLGRHVRAIEGRERASGVVLDDGDELPADLVLVGIGVKPATQFVRGLELGEDGGIPVDAELRAAPGVWAAGDVARYPEQHLGEAVRIEHWRLAEQLGRAAAFSMAGRGRPFEGVPFFWTQHFDLSLRFSGVGTGWDQTIVDGDPDAGDFVAYYAKGDQVRAACGTRDVELDAFTELMRIGRLPSFAALRRGGVRLQALLA